MTGKIVKDIEFIKNAKKWLIISAISIGAFFTRGLKLGIDFAGGTLLHLEFEKAVDVAKLREVVDNFKILDKDGKDISINASIQSVSKTNVDNVDNTEIIIQTSLLSIENRNKLKEKISNDLGINIKEELRVIDIGPTVGNILKQNATWAVFIALIAILIYITYRFEFAFGIASIIALAHDIFITLGIFSIFSIEMSSSMIAALLTIIGYSLNDTIVVSDRIRENSRFTLKDSEGNTLTYSEKVNRSINQSLSRTINTSITTLFPVLALYFFGGAMLADFALALLIGVVIGTYSSIFVVSPIICVWNKQPAKK
jgi:preprotein translocase SecF subunit